MMDESGYISVHRMGNQASRVIALAMLLLIAGCSSSFSETHYFKSVDRSGYPINYFRLTVDGYSILSSSRYQSGYYDDQTVDLYFGQMTQQDDAKFDAFEKQDSEDGIVPADASRVGTKLVLLLSSRADAISEEISNMTQDSILMKNIVQLAYRDQMIASNESMSLFNLESSRLSSLVGISDKVFENLDENATADEATRQVIFFANRLASHLGNRAPFTDFVQLKEWLEFRQTTGVTK